MFYLLFRYNRGLKFPPETVHASEHLRFRCFTVRIYEEWFGFPHFGAGDKRAIKYTGTKILPASHIKHVRSKVWF